MKQTDVRECPWRIEIVCVTCRYIAAHSEVGEELNITVPKVCPSCERGWEALTLRQREKLVRKFNRALNRYNATSDVEFE